MVKFHDEQSEVDRLRAVNAELLEALQKIYDGDCGAVSIAASAIAKATNQEAGQ